MIYSYNKSQRDALFLKFILIKNSTCFGEINGPSSGVLILYTQQQVFVMLVMTAACQRGQDGTPSRSSQKTVSITSMTNTFCCAYSIKTPDDGKYICPKHVQFFNKINLRNSASCWLLLSEYIILYYTHAIYIHIYIYNVCVSVKCTFASPTKSML